ncbi:ATP-binding cassette subfamily C protein/ATP-binding cassette subfamily C protein CydC [Streptosporangium becharense]|uniref:ATP-binding cassette subfamily C protein/ATP-binding cassette subfamily C protein CydC n=1 Tax=Streptosporangium becharense TaxID=1816182 RepID=A0A7W9ILL5_9ACTN|nr:thiol reductant ABC exporter subunit CydC [Streptosporangium becharense]MBB2915072.1 ATP-binding cassette subfamily C protein/ATP-binding cassette subfamily C protein CydC [Streptosporangium becharense]MBB5822856.1 ATP-binding cassette subfamily C protein/ATP-binding cassette subfamily C protein CydC [Streptosporangium becharense]
MTGIRDLDPGIRTDRMGRRLGLAAAAGAAAELAGLGLIGSAAWLIARAAEQPPLAALSVAIVGVRAFATSKGVFRYAERLAGHDVALRAQATTREGLYRALIPAGPLNQRGADLLSRMVDDTDAVQDLWVRCLLPAAAALVTGVTAVVIGLFVLPAAALVLLAGLVVGGVLIPAGTAAAARRWAARIAPARADLAARVADLVHGAADLAAYGANGRALAAADEADARLARLEGRRARANALAATLGVLVQGLTVVAVVLVAQGAGVGTVATTVLALTSLVSFEPVLPMAAAGERLTGVLAALRRLREIRSTPPAVTDPATPAAPPTGPLTVEVENLVVRHGADRAPALDGVSLTLTPGRRVALVGPSGAGKSTLLSALMRLVEPESGTIRVNGVELGELSADDARRLMTGLTQDPYVFQTSLRDNLRLAGPDVGQGELDEAVRRARLERWVERTGWDAVLGEDGRTVSGGQLQRLALARALLHDPPVLLLDEPAEALDETTADALMADLLDATHGRTTLLVTHRLRGLERVDEIVVLENGSVIQRGTHEQLVSSPGYYRDLWRSEALTAGR